MLKPVGTDAKDAPSFHQQVLSPALIKEILGSQATQAMGSSNHELQPTATCVPVPPDETKTPGSSMPEAEALLWAVKNLWFGQDVDMTRLAHMVRLHSEQTTRQAM